MSSKEPFEGVGDTEHLDKVQPTAPIVTDDELRQIEAKLGVGIARQTQVFAGLVQDTMQAAKQLLKEIGLLVGGKSE